ncbi:16S rRNA (cytidine(1402)-2'-O)-methyltransferase [Paracoccus aerodenitrificans]|uniref:16S rRNA (cytidine(1402)-2'-O)-methyltransferase n=1 Tax=Paracoccus aerodenitrificans TaxID=3017781 RepID=UPI0022F027AA|nr:16S rRNA (cytidine(1402)-2'-O)-methyltransferase [Paracoccus aerodenitrificans]WBU64641.1 16S rRNA (cytidine(1402)-2'-O)-methyltransferase [Paracoccus aerodenitrificans]
MAMVNIQMIPYCQVACLCAAAYSLHLHLATRRPIDEDHVTHSNDPGEIRHIRIEASRLDSGLYLVSTPIGAARDITLRALDVLNSAELLAAEDTRTLRHLMDIHGIPLRGRRIIACHDHNEGRQSKALNEAYEAGLSVAYCSEAGTPLVADPGFRLVRDAAAAGVRVHAVPGPSAALAALTVSGLPSDRFVFAGFPPQPAAARLKWLKDVAAIDATAIIFESPRRVKHTLEKLCEIDADRNIVLCRELTKKFEEILRGNPAELVSRIPDAGLKGEVVLVLDQPQQAVPNEEDIEAVLLELLNEMSVRDAAAAAAERFGISRRDAYQQALKLGESK